MSLIIKHSHFYQILDKTSNHKNYKKMSARLLYFLVIAILFSINTSAQNISRITPDLTLFELKGPVKSVSKGFLFGID